MKRVCGRLWEVVVYESQTAGSHFGGEARTHLLFAHTLTCFSLKSNSPIKETNR